MTDTNALQTSTEASVPAELLEEMARDEGEGVSYKPEDQLLPLVYILQTNSPQVQKRNPAVYIEGAEPGDFYFRGAAKPIHNGQTGIVAIPCGMQRVWIEWLPNRGGFVTQHDQPPKDMRTRKIKDDSGRDKEVLTRENGNVIVDNRQIYLLVDRCPYVLPCFSTRHTFAKEWNTWFHSLRHPQTHGLLPSYSHKYLLTTKTASNAIGGWFALQFKDIGPVSVEEYKLAKHLAEAVKAGKKRAEAPMHDEGEIHNSGARQDIGDQIPF